jgi:hypothetical protein
MNKYWGKKYRITHTQTFIPESLILHVLRQVSWLASCFLPSHSRKSNGFVVKTSLLAYSCGYSSGFDRKFKIYNSKFEIITRT